MNTIIESAVSRRVTKFYKMLFEFTHRHGPEHEIAHTGRINQVTAVWKMIKSGCGCGVSSFATCGGNRTGADRVIAQQGGGK